MATTTLPRPEPTPTGPSRDAAPTTTTRRRLRRAAGTAPQARIIPAEERELHDELVASALLLLAVLALLGAVVGGTMGVLWLLG